MSNPPVDVQAHGQSVWIDNIRRKLLNDGTFERLIADYGVVGVTSNPSIFQKAIGNSDDYDDTINNLLDLEAEAIYETLAIEDIQQASDMFRPIYDDTDGRDGYVSLEVSPNLAHDTDSTIAEAKRLYEAVDRPNVMIKIPATPEGIPAIEETIASGINVNVTLIFAVENYKQVAEAYIKGLERRMEAGESVEKIASVASFFLSRIDTLVDRMLESNIHTAKMKGDSSRVAANSKLLGKAAIANAKLAYKHFRDIFEGERFAKLRDAGASVQRPLWASTSTKNPAYADTKYVDNLIGAHTVNTMPPETLEAFKDHGKVAETLTDGIDTIEDTLDMLAEVGIDMQQVTQRLQDDGVDAFREAFDELLTQVEAKRTMLKTGLAYKYNLALGIYAQDYADTMKRLEREFVASRIWNQDGSLWKDNGPIIARIENRLGWLNVLDTIDYDRLQALQNDIKASDFEYIVLLGMGGSSLAPEVLSKTFGSAPGFPKLLMLDSTHPAQVLSVENSVDIDKTLFIVSSKSGGTVETMAFHNYFFEVAGKNGDQFIAITDPDSQLAGIAEENGFRDLFLNPADIGGRYSALSYFGLVPAAIMGLDLERIHNNIEGMIKACGPTITNEGNPAVILGGLMGALAAQGRDKVVIYASESISTFGQWVEQLVAESIGKEGKGVLPVVGATVGRPHDHATDRAFIYLKLEDDDSNAELDSKIRALREAGHPRLTLYLQDKYALFGEFFRWEFATAVTGKLVGINPFDEPNVTESKDATKRLLAYHREHGKLPQQEPFISGDHVKLFADDNTLLPLRELCRQHGYDSESRTELLAAQFAGTHAGDYFALLVYLPYDVKLNKELERVRRRLRHVTRRAVTVGYGPRYLHSTGQLHKGGPNNGVFIIITSDISDDFAIPDMPYTFGTLFRAQAAGDLETLQKYDRRVMHIHISGDVVAGINKLISAIEFVEDRHH